MLICIAVLQMSSSLPACSVYFHVHARERHILSLPQIITNSIILLLRKSKNMIDHAYLVLEYYMVVYLCVPVCECVMEVFWCRK